jgi:hypothetical protein
MSWIFTLISLIFCCVAAFYLRKAQKANLKLSQEINVRKMERLSDIENEVRKACENVVGKALSRAISAINAPESKGYLVTASSDLPKSYGVWRKVNASEEYYGPYRIGYGIAYILVKMFDSDNAEENLKNAAELCDKLNEKL